MGRQEAIFLKGEGNAWHNRNINKPYVDPVLNYFGDTFPFGSVLEIGCGSGKRLTEISLRGGDCVGIEPSIIACVEGNRNPDIDVLHGTAAKPNLLGVNFDMVIYGFCLYLCDREDLAIITTEGDRALKDGGYLIIHDFDPEYPHKVPYHHVPGLYSYKMDYSKLWLANPAYSLVHKEIIGDGTAVWVLKKDIAAGWPEEAAP